MALMQPPWQELKPVSSDFSSVKLERTWAPLADVPELEMARAGGGASHAGEPTEMPGGLYSYNNLAARPDETCGQAAIATMADFFGLNPFRLRPTVKGFDGRLHLENEAFVGAVTQQFPPGRILGFACTTPDIIESALRSFGLHTHAVRQKAWADGSEARDELVHSIRRRKAPVLALLDMPKLWPSEYKPYELHWGVIYDVGASGVSMASWHRNFAIDWSTFMDSWHCGGIPNGDFNYLQIHVWR